MATISMEPIAEENGPSDGGDPSTSDESEYEESVTFAEDAADSAPEDTGPSRRGLVRRLRESIARRRNPAVMTATTVTPSQVAGLERVNILEDHRVFALLDEG